MRQLIVVCAIASFAASAAEFQVSDEKTFFKIVDPAAKVERLATGMKFTEGPVWIPSNGGYLVFSDIPSNELKKWSPGGGLTTFRTPSANTNGNMIDGEELLISCQHSARNVVRTSKDGTIEVLVDKFEGKKFNSPNDVAVKSDGTIWFTDPHYGLPKGEAKEQEKNRVYRFDPLTKTVTSVVDDFDMPNGICFSPDQKKLYVADSGKPRHIRVFDVNKDGTVSNGKIFCSIDKGAPDGIRTDSKGRVYSSAEEGIQIFDKDGSLIGKILVPEPPANLAFGGDGGKTLFITARKSLYTIPLLVTGK